MSTGGPAPTAVDAGTRGVTEFSPLSPTSSTKHGKNTGWGDGGNSSQRGKNCSLDETLKRKAGTDHPDNSVLNVGKKRQRISPSAGTLLQTGASRALALKSCTISKSGRRESASGRNRAPSCAPILSDLLSKVNEPSAKAGGRLDESFEPTVTARVSDGPAVTVLSRCREHPTKGIQGEVCLLYTSPSPRDLSTSRMPSSA